MKPITHISVFKLWFTHRASASAVAPVSLISVHSILLKRAHKEVIIGLEVDLAACYRFFIFISTT